MADAPPLPPPLVSVKQAYTALVLRDFSTQCNAIFLTVLLKSSTLHLSLECTLITAVALVLPVPEVRPR
jgi:hypothetical protein